MKHTTRQLVQTLVVRPDERQILLGLHKAGEFAGFYTGLLGACETGEDLEIAARRVALELCELDIRRLELRAVFEFREDGSDDIVDEFEYYCGTFSGRPTETHRMQPEWFDVEAIPYDRMPADDAIWYPPFLAGKRLRGSFVFAKDGTALLSYDLTEDSNAIKPRRR